MNEAIKNSDLTYRLAQAREWIRIHGRRLIHGIHRGAAGLRLAGPVSYLCVAGAVGVAMTVTSLYTASYDVYVDGQEIGIVTEQAVVERARQQVEREGSAILGYDYHTEGEVRYEFGLSLKSNVADNQTIKNYFYDQLNTVCDDLRKYQLVLNGAAVGVVGSESELEQALQTLKDKYTTEDTVSVEFVESVAVKDVYSADEVLSSEELYQCLLENTTGETTYTVQKGDTFNGIAYRNDMSVNELKALNPSVNINRLMIGDVLNVKEQVPMLSVRTVSDETYTQSIPCPVEEVKDSSLYIGTSKIVKKGTEGEALVNATVTYLNGHEQERVVNSTQTLREPTTTTKAVGTKEKPKTASSGKYSWPIRGHINSYFGGRYIFGSYSYHSGIDIRASYGAAIKAADGGTVTFAGYKGSYGKLVIITHDNGTRTYYGHNSSLLVSSGQKVYKGQQIAKAGSTGRSTGTHCHFEIRVNGKAVNPLNYLP